MPTLSAAPMELACTCSTKASHGEPYYSALTISFEEGEIIHFGSELHADGNDCTIALF